MSKNFVLIDKKIKDYNKKIYVDGDKSLSIRWALLASQAIGISKIYNLLESEDVLNALKSIKKLGVESRVMTAISINRVAEPYIKNKASNHLMKNRVVIFASGTGNPFFSTDTAAVLRASEMKSDIILKGTKVDGIYDKDPIENKDAKKIDSISYSDYLNKDIKVMDATAISLAKDRSLPIIIFSILKSSNILDIVDGKGSFSIIN